MVIRQSLTVILFLTSWHESVIGATNNTPIIDESRLMLSTKLTRLLPKADPDPDSVSIGRFTRVGREVLAYLRFWLELVRVEIVNVDYVNAFNSFVIRVVPCVLIMQLLLLVVLMADRLVLE